MANINQYSTAKIPTADIGRIVDELMRVSKDSRRVHERRWYDNNFFDDGFHFRYLSRQQNKIVDLSERSTLWSPMRAIPKASRQIRGIANLMLRNDPIPVVYPEKVYKQAFNDPEEYKAAMDEAKRVAKTSGHWLSEEFKKHEMAEKLAHMVILSSKHSVSWMQVLPDAIKEEIKTQVYDAFDIYTTSTLTEVSDLPYIGKGIPMIISQIKANENFNTEQLEKISPDNKHASSEIKDAYMRTRYGRDYENDQTATLILKEFYIKEYLNSENRDRIAMQEDGGEILQDKKEGDQVIRQVFSAGDIWLKDAYINLPEFPFVDFRFEPGPIYQVPLIERFIPQNKSYDMLVSRAERFSHTMVTGAWAKKQGEQYKVDNSPGGQVIEYQSTPPVPLPLPSIPGFYFNLMQMMQGNIEEQGVTLSTLNKLPAGVKGYQAIESLKESEYANLVIAQRRLKGTVKRIAEKFLDIADNHFVTPQTVYYLEKGEPQYFDVIGASAMKKREDVGVPVEGEVTPISKEYRVDIEIQSGMAYTQEGKKAAAKELGDYMLQLAQLGVLPASVVSIFLQTLLETYQFGPTADVMDAMKEVEGQGNLTDEQIQAIKIAVLETLKDAQVVGPQADQKLVDSTKVGVVEALRDTGMIDKENDGGSIKEQAEVVAKIQEMKLKEESHKQQMAKGEQDMKLKEESVKQDMDIKEEEAKQDMRIKAVEKAHSLALKEKMSKATVKQMKEGQNAVKKGKK